MNRTLALAALAGLAAVPSPVHAQAPGSREIFRWHGKAATVFLRSVVGPVEVVGAPAGAEVEVVARVSWRSSDPAAVRVEAVPSARGVTFCALYAARASCGPDGEHRHGDTRTGDLQVAFQLKLPRGSALDLQLVDGDVTAGSLAGGGSVQLVNGSLAADQEAGDLEVEAVNGRVTVKRSRGAGELAVATVNGPVSVSLAAGAGAEVRTRTVNGRVEVGGRRLAGRGRVTLGAGGPPIAVQTVNGAITVR